MMESRRARAERAVDGPWSEAASLAVDAVLAEVEAEDERRVMIEESA